MRRIVVLAAVIGMLGSAFGTWSPASATDLVGSVKHPSSITFTGQWVAVTSATHQRLSMQISGAQFPVPSKANHAPGAITVQLRTPNRRETHEWTFELSSVSFNDNSSTGKGSISTGASQIAPFGHISLSLTPTGSASTQHCTKTTTVVTRPMGLPGVMWGTATSE
jgi:hypothetical protein